MTTFPLPCEPPDEECRMCMKALLDAVTKVSYAAGSPHYFVNMDTIINDEGYCDVFGNHATLNDAVASIDACSRGCWAKR